MVKINSSNVQNLESYIILPGRTHESYSYPDLLVSTERKYQRYNWIQAHEALAKEDSFMLTIRQYVDFLKLLRFEKVHDGDGKQLDESRIKNLYEDITARRDPYRAEWLDAQFSTNGNQLTIIHNQINPNGKLEKITTPVQDCLMDLKIPGINLDYWLANANSQGLPQKNSPKGDLNYWFPIADYFGWFWANLGNVNICCNGDPLRSPSGLGVRPAKIKR